MLLHSRLNGDGTTTPIRTQTHHTGLTMNTIELIRQGESENLEFKQSLSLRDEIGKAISAFSNTNGGVILVGVTDVGSVIGVDIGANTIENEAGYIKRQTDPQIFPFIKVVDVDGKNTVAIKVEESSDKPVFFKKYAHKRVGKSNQRMSSSEMRRLAHEDKPKLLWDERICEDAGLEDIDEEKVRWFLIESKKQRRLDISKDAPIKEALMRLKLMQNGMLTNASILLFGKSPQQFFIQSEVKCIRFKGIKVTAPMIDMKVMEGNLIDQVREAEKFIFNHISLASWIEDRKIQRQEMWEYPPNAIREALVNAIAHRDYISTSKVQVRIFDDRMEFWNPGRLPVEWGIEKLKVEHESMPFNPLIAKCFFWVKYAEDVGTGTNKIIEWCVDRGLPEPEFEFTGTSIVVTFRKSRLTSEFLEQLGLSDRQKNVIQYLKEHDKIDRKTYSEIYNIGKTTAYKELANLIDKGLIEMIGKGRSIFYKLRT